MINVKFSDKDYGWANWAKGLRFLGGKQSEMEVGLLDGKTDPETIFKGAVNEVGDGVNLPARPWFRNTMDANSARYLDLISTLYVKELEKGMPGGDARIKRQVGKTVAADLRDAIVAFDDPPNAPRTIRKKGFNDPLIETGKLSRSPTYRITKGK